MSLARPKKPVIVRNNKTERDIANVPLQKIQAFSKQVFSANSLMTFNRPTYTDEQLQYFEDVYGNTVAGQTIDVKGEFVIGGGIKPVFELIDDQDMDDEQKKKELEQYDNFQLQLMQIDDNVNLNSKMRDSYVMAKTFGRCATVYEPSSGIPSVLKIIHPRNIGVPKPNDKDWTIESVQLLAVSGTKNQTVQDSEMTYIVNKLDSPIRHTLGYGFSELQRPLGAARSLRRIIEFDSPEIVQSMWAPAYIILLKKLGRTDASARNEATAILNSLNAGQIAALVVDAMDEVDIKTLDLKANVSDLTQLIDKFERIIISNSQVPAALLGSEEEPNRATLLGKIKSFIEGPVKADREWLGNILAKQWYERNLRFIEGGPELLTKVRVKVEFESVIIEDWLDRVEGVQRLTTVLPNMSDKTKTDLLNVPEILDDLEEMPDTPEQFSMQFSKGPLGIPTPNMEQSKTAV